LEIRFKIDPDRITLNDQIAMEEVATLTARQLRDLLAHHLTDETGAFMETKAAQTLAGSLTKTQQVEALTAFAAAIAEASRKLVPLQTSGG
jgi:hypothetical protein